MTDQPSDATPPPGAQEYPGPEPGDDRVRVCGVCGRVLDPWKGLGWRHTFQDEMTGEADHPAVPVIEGEVPTRGRCDFCNADQPGWILPVADLPMEGPYVSQGDWSACDDCKVFIERNQWNRLADRHASEWAKRNGIPLPENLRLKVAALYRKVRKHVTGSLKPMDRPGTEDYPSRQRPPQS